jgi:mannose-6-phosphate isomerase-like protein (cupin superfamily)/DNA-binding XRE family transcriptional regulator
MNIGAQIRALRQDRGYSLRHLAALAKVSPSLLCDVEREQVNPSIGTLIQVSTALGVSVHELLPGETEGRTEPPEPAQEPQPFASAAPIVRKNERRTIRLTGGISWQRLSPDTGGPLEFIEATYAPGATSGEEMHHHPGREYGIVLEGELTVDLGFETHVLKQGDSVAFESTTPHRFSNKGTTPVRIIWVNLNAGSSPQVQRKRKRPAMAMH